MRDGSRQAIWLAAVLLLGGCGAQTTDEGAKTTGAHHAGEGHSHGPGPHGGVVAEWGGGKYHVEFAVDHDKQQATVYVLGEDAATPAPLAAERLMLAIREPRFEVRLDATPLDGEPAGSSSRFAGEHEKLGRVQEFAGTISGTVDGTPYSGDFAEGDHHHH